MAFITPPPPLCKPISLSQTLPQGLIQLSVAPAAGSGLVRSFLLRWLWLFFVAQWSFAWLCYFPQSIACVCLASGLDCINFSRVFKTPPCLQALTPSTAQGTYSRPTKTSPCHLGLLGKQVGRDRGAMGRSCVLNVVEWLNGDSVCPGPARGGGRGHSQAKESENLWCLLPSSFWLKTEASKALEGSGGHHGKESSFQISHGGSPPNVSIGLGRK